MKREIQELESKLRRLRKAERKQKGQKFGHAPRKSGRAYSEGDHEYLADYRTDPVAHTKRRMEIFRNAGGEVVWFDESDPWSVEEIRPANCEGCSETHLIGWNEGHYHHNCELEKKCDAAACGLFVCPKSHAEIHGRFIHWRKRDQKEV